MNDPVEARLKTIWCSTLSVTELRAEDDLLDVGGDSMDLVTLVARVCEEFDLEFDYHPFLEHRTFEVLLTAVRAAVSKPGSGAPQGESAHDLAISQAERGGRELLDFRLFAGASPKPTLGLAMVLTRSESEIPPDLVTALRLLQFLKKVSS